MLEAAIEAKMVQQQEAEKAVFRMQQARTDAETWNGVGRPFCAGFPCDTRTS